MSGIIDVRDWITMWVDDTVYTELRQEIEDSIDTTGAVTAVARLETLAVENCSVYLEGSDDGQQFVTVTSTGTDEDQQQVYLSASANFGTAGRLYKYLRWRLERLSAGSFYATFRIRVILTSATDGSRRMGTGTRSRPSGGALRTESGVIYFQPWTCLQGQGTAGTVEYPIQPIGQWLDTSGMAGFHVIQDISYVSNVDLVLETSPFGEETNDLWRPLHLDRSAGKDQFFISNETDDLLAGVTNYGSGGGYLRWRLAPVAPANDWVVCFRIEIVPAAQVEGRPVHPRRRGRLPCIPPSCTE